MTETVERNPVLGLLEPFPSEQIGKLPRVTCKDCSDYRTQCQKHQKERCAECGGYLSTQHIHLDYVGHADVTRRLLEVDPAWTWDPVAEDENGLPVFDTDDTGSPVGLWIKLTVLGITRRGYGSCPSKQNDAVKVLIGDALRNAAMRFGVALDLWAKGDRADPSAENAVAVGGAAARSRRNGNGRQSPAAPKTDQAWRAAMEQRVNDASTAEQLAALSREMEAKRDAGECGTDDFDHLWNLGLGKYNRLSQAQAAEPQQPAPAGVPQQRTDRMWLEGMEQRISAAAAPDLLADLAEEIRRVKADGHCEAEHEAHLVALGKKRQQDLAATAVPGPAAEPEPAGPAAGPVAEFKARITAAPTLTDLEHVKAEVMAAFKAQQLDPTGGNQLLREIKARQMSLEEAA